MAVKIDSLNSRLVSNAQKEQRSFGQWNVILQYLYYFLTWVLLPFFLKSPWSDRKKLVAECLTKIKQIEMLLAKDEGKSLEEDDIKLFKGIFDYAEKYSKFLGYTVPESISRLRKAVDQLPKDVLKEEQEHESGKPEQPNLELTIYGTDKKAKIDKDLICYKSAPQHRFIKKDVVGKVSSMYDDSADTEQKKNIFMQMLGENLLKNITDNYQAIIDTFKSVKLLFVPTEEQKKLLLDNPFIMDAFTKYNASLNDKSIEQNVKMNWLMIALSIVSGKEVKNQLDEFNKRTNQEQTLADFIEVNGKENIRELIYAILFMQSTPSKTKDADTLHREYDLLSTGMSVDQINEKYNKRYKNKQANVFTGKLLKLPVTVDQSVLNNTFDLVIECLGNFMRSVREKFHLLTKDQQGLLEAIFNEVERDPLFVDYVSKKFPEKLGDTVPIGSPLIEELHESDSGSSSPTDNTHKTVPYTLGSNGIFGDENDQNTTNTGINSFQSN